MTQTAVYQQLENIKKQSLADFFIGMDLAQEKDRTALVIMQRIADEKLKIISQRVESTVKITHKTLMFIIDKSRLPKSKNRSDRVAKKMIKRMHPPIQIFMDELS